MAIESKTKSKSILILFLLIMAAMIVLGITFYSQLKEFLNRPALYQHVLFIHIFSVTLFFANAMVGILWELRSLASKKKEVILHTYDTVAWIDARFSSPLIILSVASGITLSIMIGDIWRIGWLFLAFILFLLSGVVWVVIDSPTQYKISALIKEVKASEQSFPAELMDLLKKRLWISIAGVAPLIIVFILMVYKPEIPLRLPL